MTTRLVTFDVFDTLLTRAVGNPTSVFLLLGRLPDIRRITGCETEEFARLRMAGEHRARRGRDEVTLRQIYLEVAAGLLLPDEDARRLEELELALERRLSRIVPGAADLLTGHPDARRLALSDMYLPTEFVQELLRGHRLLDHLHAVRVSSGHGVTKSSGGLYRAVQRDENVRTREWQHYGDNALSDRRVPRLLGIDAVHLTAATLNRYEHIWEDHRWETGGLSSLVAGASRLARLDTECEPALRPIVDVAAGVAAPILAAYVLWVLRAAQRDGLRRLYFLARDGEVLLLLAQRLAARLGMDIELRYLYGSRSVYHRASLAYKNLDQATWAWTALYRLTPATVLTRLGIPAEDAPAILQRLGLGDQASQPVTMSVVRRIIADDDVARQARQVGRDLLGRVQAYLRQEGLADGTPYAIVDTGWAGRIAQSLSESLPPDAPPLRRGYLFGYMNREEGFHRPDVLHGYLFDEYAETGYWGDFDQAYGPLETFTVANHGMTVDFTDDEGTIVPVLASDTNPALRGWPWEQFREVLFRFADALVLDRDIASIAADLRAPVAAVLTEFWSHPTEAEARAWGAYTYEDDILATSRNPLAAPIRAGDFVGKARKSYEGKRMWLSGSVQLSPRSIRPAARAGLWVNDRRRAPGGITAFVPPRWGRRLRLLGLAVRSRSER